MKGKICYKDKNQFWYLAFFFFSALQLGVLTLGIYGIETLLEPVSSNQLMNCILSTSVLYSF